MIAHNVRHRLSISALAAPGRDRRQQRGGRQALASSAAAPALTGHNHAVATTSVVLGTSFHFTLHFEAGCVFFGAAERGKPALWRRIVGAAFKRIDSMGQAAARRGSRSTRGCTRRRTRKIPRTNYMTQPLSLGHHGRHAPCCRQPLFRFLLVDPRASSASRARASAPSRMSRSTSRSSPRALSRIGPVGCRGVMIIEALAQTCGLARVHHGRRGAGRNRRAFFFRRHRQGALPQNRSKPGRSAHPHGQARAARCAASGSSRQPPTWGDHEGNVPPEMNGRARKPTRHPPRRPEREWASIPRARPSLSAGHTCGPTSSWGAYTVIGAGRERSVPAPGLGRMAGRDRATPTLGAGQQGVPVLLESAMRRQDLKYAGEPTRALEIRRPANVFREFNQHESRQPRRGGGRHDDRQRQPFHVLHATSRTICHVGRPLP